MRSACLAWLIVLGAPVARADCDDQLAKLNHDLGYPSDSPAYIACRTWPLEASKTIIVLARKSIGSGSLQVTADAEGIYDLDVIVQATDSGKILLRSTEKGALTSDAIALQGVAVDEARFAVAKDVSAFGVRTQRSNRNVEIEMLSLYAVRDDRIVRILAPLQTVLGICESPDGMQCSRTSVTRGNLALSHASTAGWTDLWFTQRNSVQTFQPDGSAITAEEDESVRTFRLRFDADGYVIPKGLLSEAY